ncbi:uncharacterized protein BDW43DRAFT_302069 [Aspergillus alliaceus]|uniref:uncharacterized protein n=1 Tax=Petromyces alliaceus TaxID=209559 RepID=UPI0012A607FF|nr:uncharacterized protein BDW43DRAFT_302069 [Aspergillus alliaceus]KAB8230973.1 hypothetical protein BDW43DRAFT_302069 [Aspergillus alliaceus]
MHPGIRSSYTVAWICTLEEAYICACRMLDKEFTGPEMMDDHDDNTYIYERIVKHNVVITCLPTCWDGTNSAARVARDMARTFPNLRFALMPKDGFGDVIQYDLGKQQQNGQFQRTGRLYSDKTRPERVAEHLQQVDQLYMADCHHVGGENCNQCYSHSVVERPERQNHCVIYVHYRTISSRNSVLKDAFVGVPYANDPELNILCFEMEAAGLMNNIPCPVLRGVCNYCESHKNEIWHNYTSLTTPTYVRELLLVLRPQRVEAMPFWAGQVVQGLQQG